MSTGVVRECPDCQGAMQPIRLVDKAHHSAHEPLEYTVLEAERSLWAGRYPIEGRVNACMCGQCGRIVLYGAPYSQR